jgi:glycosyltransferase involved in cell wall biosynthesis
VKIAIDVRKWQDYGIGTYVRNLVRHLARIDTANTYFLFCHPADEPTLRDLSENFVPVIDASAKYGLREHFSIPLKLRRLGAELLHSPHYVRPLLCTVPSVVTVHDCIHLLFPQYLPSRLAHYYARFVMGSAIAHSALVYTVSQASRADILRFYPGTNPEKVVVVPNAIDAELLVDPGEEERERVRERYQLRGRFVLFAGNVKPHKNLERLIRAFAAVRAQAGRGDLRLVLIGDDVSRYSSLRRTVEEAGVRPDVRFFGFVPHRTLAALYRMASVFAFPSLYEGFGLPPLEAMACGTPVLTTRLSSLPEVVGDGALLVDPYDEDAIAGGLARLIDDEDLRQSLAAKGLARAATFSWERSVRAIHGGYMRALGRRAEEPAEALS